MADTTLTQSLGADFPAPDLGVYRETVPFREVSEDLLRRIAELGHHTRYRPGERIYSAGDEANDIFVVVSGRIEHVFAPEVGAREALKRLTRGAVFGWAGLLLGQTRRLATSTAIDACEVVRIDSDELLKALEEGPVEGYAVMERFASMIIHDFTVPEFLAQIRRLSGQPLAEEMTRFGLTLYRVSTWLKSPRPYLMLVGFVLFFGFWYLAVEVWKLPRFREMPGITVVLKEWFNPNPVYGLSVYTPEYYTHIWMSVWRVAQAFFLATVLGVPVGLFLGWSRKFKEYVFPIFETLRPIPDTRLGAARDRDVHLGRIGGDLPHLPGVVLRHRAEHDAGSAVDRRILRARRVLPRGQPVAGVPSR